jgi:hypothetical protein
MASLPDLSMQNGRRATHNLTLFSSSGTAIHLSIGHFSALGKYLAPMDWGFRIRIVANEPIRTGAGPATKVLSGDKKAVRSRSNDGSYQDSPAD